MTMATETWYASPDFQDAQATGRYERVAVGAKEALYMLRDAEEIARVRACNPTSTADKLLIVLDGSARLFADETYGFLLQARAHSLGRTGPVNGVRLVIRR